MTDDRLLRERLQRLAPQIDVEDGLHTVHRRARRGRARRPLLVAAGAAAAVALLAGAVVITQDDDAEQVVAGPSPSAEMFAGGVTPVAEGVVVRMQGEQDWTVVDLDGQEIGSVSAAANGVTVPGYDVTRSERPLLIDLEPQLRVVEQWTPTPGEVDGEVPQDCDRPLAAADLAVARCVDLAEQSDRLGPGPLPRTVEVWTSEAGWEELAGPPAEFPTGHWRWALPSPDGRHVALQWSGECEAPTAFVASYVDDPDRIGWSIELVVPDPDVTTAVLGWTADGEMIVESNSLCGSAIDGVAGVYLIPPGGEPELLVAAPEPADPVQFAEVLTWSAAETSSAPTGTSPSGLDAFLVPPTEIEGLPLSAVHEGWSVVSESEDGSPRGWVGSVHSIASWQVPWESPGATRTITYRYETGQDGPPEVWIGLVAPARLDPTGVLGAVGADAVPIDGKTGLVFVDLGVACPADGERLPSLLGIPGSECARRAVGAGPDIVLEISIPPDADLDSVLAAITIGTLDDLRAAVGPLPGLEDISSTPPTEP